MTPKEFIAALSSAHLPNVFNPYADLCDRYDLPNARRLRRQNLENVLDAALACKVDTIWIARDLGHRGGRRTGLALTDEVHLSVLGELLGGIDLRQATRGAAMAERTAAVIWHVLTRVGEPVLLWNVFPFHPHVAGKPFSNRSHTASERETARPFLKMIVNMLHPRRMVAIGRDAEKAIDGLGVEVISVRHPSYGGQPEFLAETLGLYGLTGEAPSH